MCRRAGSQSSPPGFESIVLPVFFPVDLRIANLSDDSLMPAYLVTLETPFTTYSRYVICYVSTSNKHFISAVNDLHPWVFYAFSRPLGELVHNRQAREYWPEAGRVKHYSALEDCIPQRCGVLTIIYMLTLPA